MSSLVRLGWSLACVPCVLVVLASTASPQGAEPPSATPAASDLWTRSRGGDWPTFLGSRQDARSEEKGIRTDWSGGLPILWRREIGEGYSAPSVAHGRLFLFDRYRDRARLVCLRAETGEELWRSEYTSHYEDYYGYSNGPRASPVVDGDRVYTFGAEGMLRAHRVSDGVLLWQVDTAARFGVVQNFFGVGSTPAVEGDLLIVMVGGSPPGSPSIHSGRVQPNGSAVVAFDKLDGAVRYEIGDDLASYAAIRLATIGDRRWGFAFTRGGLLGFDPSTGAVDFHYPWHASILESVNAATPVVVGNHVLISETYGPGASLLAVRPRGYDVVWRDASRRDRSLACHWNTPVHEAGVVYASSGRNPSDAELRAVELHTGKVLWSEPGLQRATLLSVDGHFVVLSEDGVLRLVRHNRDKYDPVAEITLRENGRRLIDPPAWNAPVLAHGILYLQGRTRLVAVELIADSGSSN
jgi:outer membrane protein assembly factor BamB